MYWMSLSLLVLTTTWVASPAQQAFYYNIVTVLTEASTCNISSNEACYTLQQFANEVLNSSTKFFLENITLTFAPGKHLLVGGIKLYNTANIVINSQFNSENMPEITCKGESCFTIRNTSTVHIESLVFTECFNEDTDGGAVFVSRAKVVNISQCLFTNNFVRKRGGAMRLQLIDYAYVLHSQFINNSATCHPSNTTVINGTLFCLADCISGAISGTLIRSLSIEHSLVEDNTGSCLAGAIAVTSSSSISVYNCKFLRNQVVGKPATGGALSIYSSTALILDSQFDGNWANSGGGISTSRTVLHLMRCSFTSNRADFFGGAAYFTNTQLLTSNAIFSSNTGKIGGAIVIDSINNNSSFTGSVFENNTGIEYAGSMYLTLTEKTSQFNLEYTEGKPVVLIVACTFKSNKVIGELPGATVYAFGGVLLVTNSEFNENTGGAVTSMVNIAYIQNNRFINNTANILPLHLGLGGALYVGNGTVYSSSNRYSSNKAITYGGAIHAVFSTVVCINDVFTSNMVEISNGGAISAFASDVSVRSCIFTNNIASSGSGAVHVWEGNFSTVQSVYTLNTAGKTGAPSAVFLIGSRVSFSGDSFYNHTAYSEPKAIAGQNFQRNNLTTTESSDQAYTIQLTNSYGPCYNVTFSNNYGSMYLFSSTVNFSGSITLAKNVGVAGGALTLVLSTITFEEWSEAKITDNSATYGGGIFLSQSDLKVYTSSLTITNNLATASGGGMFGYQSRIMVTVVMGSGSVAFTCNTAAEEGGAMFATATSLLLSHGSVLFLSNKAMKGGAAALSEGSKIYLQKTAKEQYNELLSMNLTFSANTADYGGAVYVNDFTNTGVLCKQSSRDPIQVVTTAECFIQTLRLYYDSTQVDQFNYMNIFFHSNTARKSGNDIFGGLLDRCQLNAFSEILNFEIAREFRGFTSLKAIAHFQIDVDYNNMTRPFNIELITDTITKKLVKRLISSNPVQLCFCVNNTHNCSQQWPTIYSRKGEPFSVQAVTADQVENMVAGTVVATTSTKRTNFKVSQSQQATNGTCTNVQYNVFSTEPNATIELYPSGPCEGNGISSKILQISFLPCECPNGLQQALLDNECRCECDLSLNAYISRCQLDNDSVTVVRVTNNFWIQYVLNANVKGFMLQTCPYDYCVQRPVNLTISLPLHVDRQCAYNRSGVMCGECKDGLSLVFGSSRCVECSSSYLALLIAFAIAGIALVALILILNMTVAIGTIHGLILYANIVAANSNSLLLSETTLRIFITWINLDLGFETCFYNGLDSLAKVWLQLVFPAYIISLSALIIIVSHYWGRFAGLIGRKNPVATLCTLFLLSYSKLLRTIIALLQFTDLTHPSGSKKVLWLYNPNIPYYSSSRIPFFIIAIVIIALGTVYTLLLFLGQWLRKVKQKNIARFFQSNKYNAFIDAYHAPFVFKHRYWIGILLFARIFHHLLSAVLKETSHLLLVSCIVYVLLILKMLTWKMYKNWLIGFLETSFLINLLVFSVTTYYISITNGDQLALANTSVSIAFITFTGIILYHTNKYVLKNLRIYSKLAAAVRHHLYPPLRVLKCWKGPIKNTGKQIEKEMNPFSSVDAPLLREPDTAAPTPRKPNNVTSTIIHIERNQNNEHVSGSLAEHGCRK